MAAIAGSLSTGLLGAIVGVYHYRRKRGLMWGSLTGLILGAFLGPVSLAPLDLVPSLFALSAAGAALLVAVAAFFRWSKRERPVATSRLDESE